MASDAIHDEMRILVTIRPIIRPETTPTKSPQTIPNTGFTWAVRPMTTPLRANTAPTDKSISAHRMTNVIPRAKNPPFLAAFSKILNTLAVVRKFLS